MEHNKLAESCELFRIVYGFRLFDVWANYRGRRDAKHAIHYTAKLLMRTRSTFARQLLAGIAAASLLSVPLGTPPRAQSAPPQQATPVPVNPRKAIAWRGQRLPVPNAKPAIRSTVSLVEVDVPNHGPQWQTGKGTEAGTIQRHRKTASRERFQPSSTTISSTSRLQETPATRRRSQFRWARCPRPKQSKRSCTITG